MGFRDPKAAKTFPQLVIAAEHYNRIMRTLEKKIPVRLEMNVENKFYDDDLNAFNIVGEIRGTDLDGEIVPPFTPRLGSSVATMPSLTKNSARTRLSSCAAGPPPRAGGPPRPTGGTGAGSRESSSSRLSSYRLESGAIDAATTAAGAVITIFPCSLPRYVSTSFAEAITAIATSPPTKPSVPGDHAFGNPTIGYLCGAVACR